MSSGHEAKTFFLEGGTHSCLSLFRFLSVPGDFLLRGNGRGGNRRTAVKFGDFFVPLVSPWGTGHHFLSPRPAPILQSV